MAHILELKPEEQIVRSYLKRAVDGSNPSLLGLRLVQRFANETPDLFCNAALTLLETEEDCAALRFMSAKLLRQPGLMSLLSDPSRFERIAAIRLFRLLKQHDRSLDIRLAQSLPDRYGISQLPSNPAFCERALDVLDDVSDGRRIVPIVGHLVDHPSPWISAKAALVVGRRVQSVNWAKRLLTKERNPRDRANALEALWGLESRESRNLMWEHIEDKSNRVSGNAVFGLHLLGEPIARSAVEKMATRIHPDFRWTSAWLMGKIRQDQHVPMLKQMIKDESPGVRRAALKALVGIRQEVLREEAEAARIREAQEAALAASQPKPEPQPEPAGVWPELAPDPLLDPGEPTVVMPDFNLRLDGRSFSFRGK